LGQLGNAAFGSVGLLLNMTGNENQVARIVLQTALLNVVLNSLFTPFYGMSGAAIASTISILLWNALSFLRVRNSLGITSCALVIKRNGSGNDQT
jgi:O-antigen/teichoic acid export membrane protein